MVYLVQHYFGFVHCTKNYLFDINSVIRHRDPKYMIPNNQVKEIKTQMEHLVSKKAL